MEARLKDKGWLRRTLAVSTADGSYTVEYSGRGAGYETVAVNNEIVVGETSNAWFVPQFEFKLGTMPAVLDVRVWPWLAVRSLTLSVGGTVLYNEGNRQPPAKLLTGPSRLESLGSGWHFVIQSLVALLVLPSLLIILRQLVRGGIDSFGVAASWAWPALIALVVSLVVAWGYFANTIYAGHHTTMTPEGIRQQQLFGRDRYLPWENVSKWSFRSRLLVLEGVREEIRINFFHFRRPDLAAEYAVTQLRRTHIDGNTSAT